MRVGRKSILFGMHQVLWHPLTVILAWRRLYGRLTGRELVAILVHDWGYWFTRDIDGEEGQRHPELGAKIAGRIYGPEYRDLVLYHSRYYAWAAGVTPSRLAAADKLSILYEPAWWYLFRCRLTGELAEYRRESADFGAVPLTATDREWFDWIRGYLAEEGRGIARLTPGREATSCPTKV